MSKFLVAWGSNMRNIFVYCSNCGKKQVWIRLFSMKPKGYYRALCAKCKKEIEKGGF